jgi:hypothetical protein
VESFIIYILGSIAAMLCLIFAFQSAWPDSAIITIITAIGTISAVIAAVSTVVLLQKQVARWNDEDRPRVQAYEIQILPGQKRLILTFLNKGKEDAVDLSILMAAVDFGRSSHLLESTADMPSQLHRLRPGTPYRFSFMLDNGDDRRYLMECTQFSNSEGTAFDDPPNFFYAPNLPLQEMRYPASEVGPTERENLSTEFHCPHLSK